VLFSALDAPTTPPAVTLQTGDRIQRPVLGTTTGSGGAIAVSAGGSINLNGGGGTDQGGSQGTGGNLVISEDTPGTPVILPEAGAVLTFNAPTLQLTTVPEPGSLALSAVGLGALVALLRRRRV